MTRSRMLMITLIAAAVCVASAGVGAAAGGGFVLGAAAVPWGRHGSGSDV